MIKTLSLAGEGREKERFFRKRDPEGRFIFNNVLLNGHVHMLEYLLTNWVEAHANLPLTLEGNTTVLHQALCRAAFCKTSDINLNSNLDVNKDVDVCDNISSPVLK